MKKRKMFLWSSLACLGAMPLMTVAWGFCCIFLLGTATKSFGADSDWAITPFFVFFFVDLLCAVLAVFLAKGWWRVLYALLSLVSLWLCLALGFILMLRMSDSSKFSVGESPNLQIRTFAIGTANSPA
jgi:hypothetical protein